MLAGSRPFSGECDELIMDKIIHNEIPLKPTFSLNARDLLERLLCRDPNNRMCSIEGATEIKKHPFFFGINWEELVHDKNNSVYSILSKEKDIPSISGQL